jgi:hypothetical protein
MRPWELVAGSFFPHALSGLGGFVYAIVLALVALGLIFAGRSIIKGIAFLAVGLAGAAFGLATGALILGPIGAIIGGVVGFLVGGVLGIFLVEVGMGLALGYFGYLATRYLVHSLLIAVGAGIVLFFVGLAMSNKLLELVTAVLGGVILYGVLVFFGLAPLYAAVVSIVLAAAGFYVQKSKTRRGEQWRKM